MTSYIIDLIRYRKPHKRSIGRPILSVIGLDTETYIDGKPFLFCTSDGLSFTLSDIPKIFFTRELRGKHFGVYNLKFDSGSILYSLPLKKLNELREAGKTKFGDYVYKYIPHKWLRITKGKDGVTFWNIAQYYRMSLDNAAKKYLNEGKLELETKSFTRSYVKVNIDKIRTYCIRDALLTARLYDYMLIGLQKLKVTPTALYSTASIAQQYFKRNCVVSDVWKIWIKRRYVLQYALEAYGGGKFEVYKRGIFNGVTYDINSAYPENIKQLYSLEGCDIRFTVKYIKEAQYGFLRVRIDNEKAYNLPCGLKNGYLRVYPAGTYYATITKQEYDYLQELKIPVTIQRAYWIICRGNIQPYSKTIETLYALKTQYKNLDKRMYLLTKMLMNSFYGKMIQKIEQPDGTYRAGACWNPIHGSYVTAMTRIAVSRICNDYEGKILSVHTDSVMSTVPIKTLSQTDNLGDWSKVYDGDGVLVQCGLYQIGKKVALRGFVLDESIDLYEILKRMNNQSKYPVLQLHVPSWFESANRNRPELTNVFIKEPKIMDVNSERKRQWEYPATGKTLLSRLQPSAPPLIIQR